MPLVAAFACPHTPQLLVRPETEDRDMVLRVHAAYGEVKRLLEATRPDVICVVAGDHVEGFFLTSVPALAVYVGASVSGKFDRYRYTFDVHEPLARTVLEQGIERGFDLTYSQDLALDYAFFVPLHFTMPEPRARGADGLGRALTLPRHRPVQLAGLRLGPADAGSARGGTRQRDGRAHRRRAGQGRQCRVQDLDHASGRRRSGQGPRDLLRALLASWQRHGDVAARMSLHYTFPPASGYPLNRCLYQLKSDDAFRERYLKDPEATLREAGLDPERIAALRALDRDKLLALGAHAYLVFMASLRLKMATAPQTFERF